MGKTSKWASLPKQIKELMLVRQVEAGNEANPEAFILQISRSKSGGGFDWCNTPEGSTFWDTVTNESNFKLFFQKYSRRSAREKYPKYVAPPSKVVCLYTGKYALKKNTGVFSDYSDYSGARFHHDDDEVTSTPDGFAHIEDDDLTFFSDEYYFTDRLDDYRICWDEWNDCHEWKNNCRHGYTSSYGSGWFNSEDEVYSSDSATYFMSPDVAESRGYYYLESADDYIHEDERYRFEEKNNAGYHDLERLWDCDMHNTKFTIGFEVEKEDDDAYQIKYQKLYNDTKWIKESDGSLDSGNGYELVSPVYDLYGKKLDADITRDDLVTLIDAEYSSNCGGHINIGSNSFTTKELNEGLSCFYPLLYAMYENRLGQTYCVAKNKNEYHQGNEKYSAIYVKSKVLEFRIFPAVRDVKNLIWRRDLMRIFVNNINKSEVDVLKMLVNKKSLLYKHLSKIFSEDKIMQKANLFIKYSKLYNNRNLDNNRGGLAI